MSVILVDYENTGHLGLNGVEYLKEEDILVVFYSDPNIRTRRENLILIEESGCVFRTCKLIRAGKNYLDRYIDVAVGEYYQKGEREIAIISKDKGYQAVMDYFSAMGVDTLRIVRSKDIESALCNFVDSEVDKERRDLISFRRTQVNIEEYSIRMDERNAIIAGIKEELSKSPYWYRTKDVCEFATNQTFPGRKAMYTNALKSFGREEGIVIYNILR